jgi:hypothetical protein
LSTPDIRRFYRKKRDEGLSNRSLGHYARDIYPGFSEHAHHRDTESIRADLASEGDAQAKIRCPWATMAEEPPRVNTASFTSFSACPNSGVTSP